MASSKTVISKRMTTRKSNMDTHDIDMIDIQQNNFTMAVDYTHINIKCIIIFILWV